MKNILSLIFLLFISSIAVYSQQFTVKVIELAGNNIKIVYDLIDSTKSRVYTINLYSSLDSYVNPLQRVSGDIGLEVKPGTDKTILWNAKEELGASFHGEFDLEVRGKVYTPFIQFNDFKNGRTFRRGRASTITWSGGTRQNILNFSIYNGDEFLGSITNIANSGSTELVIPTNVPPGKGYHFIVSDTRNKDQMMKTSTFNVKRKHSLGAKLIPVLALIAVPVYFIFIDTEPEDVSGPPGLPSQQN